MLQIDFSGIANSIGAPSNWWKLLSIFFRTNTFLRHQRLRPTFNSAKHFVKEEWGKRENRKPLLLQITSKSLPQMFFFCRRRGWEESRRRSRRDLLAPLLKTPGESSKHSLSLPPPLSLRVVMQAGNPQDSSFSLFFFFVSTDGI